MIRYIEDGTRTLSGIFSTARRSVAVNTNMNVDAQQCQSMMFYYLWIFFRPSSSLLFSCLGADRRTHQCEILLDIITHYYLLEFDFLAPFIFCCLRQFALTCFARHTLQFQSFVWFRLFLLLLLFCCFFFLLGGVYQLIRSRWNFLTSNGSKWAVYFFKFKLQNKI